MHRHSSLLIGLAALLPAVAHATDADVEAFYRGRQMRLVVGSSAGAGFDLYARMVAKHLANHIPGRPQIVPGNLPGAASLRAVQSLRIEPRDGSYIVLFNPGLIMASLLTPEQVAFRFTDVAFLGSASAEIRTCFAWHTTGVRTLADLLARPQFATGHTGTGASTYIDAAIIKNVLGAKLKQITGYPGLSEQRVAVERGELDGDCGPYASIPPDWITSGKAQVVVLVVDAGQAIEHQDLTIGDLVSEEGRAIVIAVNKWDLVGATASPEQQKLIEFVLFYHELFRPFIVSREVPAERLAALREAFWTMVQSAEFQDDARRQGREVVSPMRWEDAERIVAGIYKTPKEMIAKAAEIIK